MIQLKATPTAGQGPHFSGFGHTKEAVYPMRSVRLTCSHRTGRDISNQYVIPARRSFAWTCSLQMYLMFHCTHRKHCMVRPMFVLVSASLHSVFIESWRDKTNGASLVRSFNRLSAAAPSAHPPLPPTPSPSRSLLGR